jgi:hypothetical protein
MHTGLGNTHALVRSGYVQLLFGNALAVTTSRMPCSNVAYVYCARNIGERRP